MNIFFSQWPIFHLQKYWLFLLNHPVQHRSIFTPRLVAVEWLALLLCSNWCSCPLCSAQSPLFTPWTDFLLFPWWRQKPYHQIGLTIFSFGCHPESSLYVFSQQLYEEILWWEIVLRYSQPDTLILLHMFRTEAICVLVSAVPITLRTVSPSYLNIIITVIIKRPIIDFTATVTVNIHCSSFTIISHQLLLMTHWRRAFWRLRSSGLWQCDAGWVDASISNDHSAFLPAPEEGGTQWQSIKSLKGLNLR